MAPIRGLDHLIPTKRNTYPINLAKRYASTCARYTTSCGPSRTVVIIIIIVSVLLMLLILTLLFQRYKSRNAMRKTEQRRVMEQVRINETMPGGYDTRYGGVNGSVNGIGGAGKKDEKTGYAASDGLPPPYPYMEVPRRPERAASPDLHRVI